MGPDYVEQSLPEKPGQQLQMPLLQVPLTQLEHAKTSGAEQLELGKPLQANSQRREVVL